MPASSRWTLNVCRLDLPWKIEVSVLHILASAKLDLLLCSNHTFDVCSPQVKILQRLEEDFTLKRNFSRICTCIRPLLKPLHKTWTIEIKHDIN